ncbi:hypothetical protein B0A49_11932 [Cryomyces minteri]|uniref:ubiquitinyl hydrolase 1 n=1 Tax=Cryomyces minteri TaxID=331657 RepID=A0A4V5NGM6_9PEZI|nr:hypothetical protein B0A49_11932 [Cryomyces minteri]
MDHDDNAVLKSTLGIGVMGGSGAEGEQNNEPSPDGLKYQPCSSNRQEDVRSLQDACGHAWEDRRSLNLKTADGIFGSRDTSTPNTDPVAESTSTTSVTSSSSTPPPAYNGPGRHYFEGTKHQMPTLDEQVNRVKELMHQAFQSRAKEGIKGYVVSMKWLNRVIARTSDAQQEGGHDKAALEGDIGPVDNSTIVPEGWKLDPLGTKDELGLPFVPLRQGLQMGLDLEVVPEDAWQLIMEWYGLSQGSHPIIRYMHDTTPEGSLQHNLQFDLFPPILTIRKLAKNGDTGALAPFVIAPQHELFQAFLRRAKEAAGANMGNKVKLWRVLEPVESESAEPGSDTAGILTPATSRSGSPSSQLYAAQCPVKLVVGVHSFKSMIEGTHREMIDMKDETMNEKYNGHLRTGTLGLLHDQILVIEPQFKVPGGGEYISDDARKYSKKSAAKSQYPQAQRNGNVSPAPSGPITRGRARNDGRPRGMVGLTNLGNTCYMNSALQCVRSIEELTYYFLEQQYKEELNVDNPLGHHGKMAKVYADFLANIYSERASSSFSPGDFKRTLGSCQPLFSGYGQQDSQEFLSFLVDALHEDLNRIHKKPYIENPESDDKTVNDSEAIRALGEKFRENHRARNDSVAMDLFSGFYKNTMVCPQCNKVSITFDPFSLLTLQLPMEVTWTHTVTFAPLHKAPVQVAVDMDKNGTIRNLKEYVAKRITPSPKWNQLMAAEIYSHKFYKLLEDNKTIAETSISDTDEIVLYELDDIPTNFPGPSPQHNKVRSMVTYGNTSSDEEKPDPDSPRGDRMVVPVFHRVLRNHSKGLKLWPSFVLLTRDEAKSYDEVLRKVLAKVATMTSRDVLSEDSTFAQSRNDFDTVLTTEEDASSMEGPKVTTTSIESEDGIVDVSMSDAPDPVAARGLENVEGTLTHEAAQGASSLPSVLQPGSFIPPSLQGLFEMKYFKEKNAVPTGWSSFSDTRDYPTLQSRMRQPSARRNSTQSVQSRGSQDSGFAQQSGNSSDADDIPELTNNQPNAPQADADSDDSMPSMEGLLARRSPQGRQRALNGKPNKFKTYSNKGRRNSRQSVRSARSARSTASKSSNEEPVEVVSPSLIRLGEGIILDWSADSFDALFEGSPHSEDEWRGHDTWNDMHLVPDPELDAQKAKRAARKKNGITLGDCFAETAKSEILSEENAWYCNRCKELRRASKTLEIWTVPDILVVHLKRFSANRGFRDKIDVLVDFPINGLDLSDRVGLQEGKGMLYDLFAVDNHYGGLGGGHYTACAQNFFDKMWYDYNDSHVSRITPEHAVASSAYLLFYRRRASHSLGPPYLQKIVAEMHGPLQDSDSQTLPVDTSAGNGQRPSGSSPLGSSNILTTEAAAEGETEAPRLRGGAGTGTTETRVGNDETGIEECGNPDEVLPYGPPAAPTYHSGATDWNFDGIALGARTNSDDELGGLGGGSVFDDAASNGVNMGQDLNERLLEDFGDDMDFQDMGVGSSRAGTGTPVDRDTTPGLVADESRYATTTVHLSPPVEDMDDDLPIAEVRIDEMEYTKVD